MKSNTEFLSNFRLSILMPAYNEKATLKEAIDSALDSPYNKEIIVVDDGSTDGTWEILQNFNHPDVVKVFHKKNFGKGRAIRSGLSRASGDIILIQDADLEYDPADYPNLLGPILIGKADVVYGSRFAGHGAHRVLYFWHYIGNKFLTLLSNVFTNLNLTDMECCYKAFTRAAVADIDLKEDRFGFEPEITAKMAKKRLRIYEVPISYYGRSYEEGKKINWKDGLWALWCVIKYNIR